MEDLGQLRTRSPLAATDKNQFLVAGLKFRAGALRAAQDLKSPTNNRFYH